MQFSILAFTAAVVSLVSAITVPGGSNPSGNSINLPTAGQIVPVGSPFTITWTPTTTGTVTLVLLQGPSTNVQPIAYIAQNISNSGSYSWTPPTSLAPDTTHYGIELIVDSTQAYQYTSQFGISNPSYSSLSSATSTSAYASASTSGSSSSSSSTNTSSASATNSSSSSSTTTTASTTSSSSASASLSTTTIAPVLIITTASAKNTSASASNATTYHAPSSPPAPAFVVSSSTTVVSGTKTVVVPVTVQTSASGSATAAAG
ncbi:MAG: hypothetical protein LQ347_004780, partial [Umbilicaria vellea]